MAVPTLLSIELTYGCHAGRFVFPRREGPIVILGPNGAGKTTLMEALVLTLYGMDLRKEPKRLEARVPWHFDECHATIVLSDEHGDELSVERNFRTQEVVVRRVENGQEDFRGDASPSAANAEASRYRRWLAEHLGLEDRSQYESTACVNQGELVLTRLGEHLLLLAAGGHRDVATALADIESSYYDLTQEPLVEGDRRASGVGNSSRSRRRWPSSRSDWRRRGRPRAWPTRSSRSRPPSTASTSSSTTKWLGSTQVCPSWSSGER